MHEKEHDFFSFRGAWLLFVFSLVASLLCLPPTATAGHETEQNRLGFALAPFYFFGMTYP